MLSAISPIGTRLVIVCALTTTTKLGLSEGCYAANATVVSGCLATTPKHSVERLFTWMKTEESSVTRLAGRLSVVKYRYEKDMLGFIAVDGCVRSGI